MKTVAVSSNKIVNSLEKVAFISLPTFSDKRGILTVAESGRSVPFSIVRIFYIYGVNQDCERGAHAHRQAEQVFIAIAGSFSLSLSDGQQSKTYVLQEANRAVYVPSMVWAHLDNFSSDAICVVLTNSSYDPDDYIRDWNEFILTVNQR